MKLFEDKAKKLVATEKASIHTETAKLLWESEKRIGHRGWYAHVVLEDYIGYINISSKRRLALIPKYSSHLTEDDVDKVLDSMSVIVVGETLVEGTWREGAYETV